jgi:hypothetical protein
MFPGLSDLHTHHTYNMLPIWLRPKDIPHPWDNRFEWRWCSEYTKAITIPSRNLQKNWDKSFEISSDNKVAYGDLLLYFAEIQAVAGGSTVLQESSTINPPDKKDDGSSGMLKAGLHDEEETLFYYPFMRHSGMLQAYVNKGHLLLRSTGIASELGIEDAPQGVTINSVVDLLGPVRIDTPIIPHIDTSAWSFNDAKNVASGTAGNASTSQWEQLKGKLEKIAAGNVKDIGYIVHLGEGRCGNLCPDEQGVDGYSRKEVKEFIRRMKNLMKDEPTITSDVVKKLHINLIHACGFDIADSDDYKFLKDNGIGLIWSPVSNLLLYEDTPAFYDNIKANDITLGLGSDWSPSGSKHVWDECKFACKYLRAKLPNRDEAIEEDVLKMVTLNAAKLVGSDKIGDIKKGGFADFFVLKGNTNINANKFAALDAFYNVSDTNVQFVMIGGNVIYGENSYFDKFKTTGRLIPSDVQGLKNKMVYMPDEISIDLTGALKELDAQLASDGTSRSMFRSSEDATYTNEINDLEKRFAVGTPYVDFDDSDYVRDKKRITEIVIRSGWILDGIQFIYDDDATATHYHGSPSGEEQHCKLGEGEYIVSIKGTTARYTYSSIRIVGHIEIRTNKGNVFTGGINRGCSDCKDFNYVAGTNQQIFSLSGSYRGYLGEFNVAMKNL